MIINSADYIKGGTKIEHFPQDDRPEILFCGRSNVGKSSFINALVNKVIARTSSSPGKTQVLNFFNINDLFYLVDAPGYGYAKVSQKQKEQFGQMIEEYLTKRKTLRAVFLLVDFRHDPTEDDILMLDFLRFYQIETYIIATKKDKVNQSQAYHQKKAIMQKLRIPDDHLFITSSEKKEGFMEVLSKIEAIIG